MEEGMVCGMLPSSSNVSAQDKVTKEWDSMAGEWDDMAAGYAAGLHRVLWDDILGTANNVVESWTVLDFGCGTGLLTERIKDQVKRVVAVDASREMIRLLQDKIQCRPGFDHVSAHVGLLANLGQETLDFRRVMESCMGSVDLIVASSVLNFILEEDLEATCQVLGRLLKSNNNDNAGGGGGGILVHTDWPSGQGQPADGMTSEKAERIYAMAGLTTVSTHVGPLRMSSGGEEETNVFFGVAKKKQQL